MRVGFIGLGSQGGPMAERILTAGFKLTVWARRAEVIVPFAEKGADVADSVAALAQTCDHIGVCVVDDVGVIGVCADLIPAMKAGSCLVVHSTILPESCVALAVQCAERGIAFLDAPVSGGGPAAAAGILTVMCGGESAAFESTKPVFETFAKTIVHLGAAGAGQRAKIVNNALMAANMGLAHAALGAGEALGMDRAALASLIKDSSGRSFGMDVYARLPAPAAFAHGAALLRKDVNLLSAILPDDARAQALRTAADSFLEVAIGP